MLSLFKNITLGKFIGSKSTKPLDEHLSSTISISSILTGSYGTPNSLGGR
jgi:hypothetical protein